MINQLKTNEVLLFDCVFILNVCNFYVKIDKLHEIRIGCLDTQSSLKFKNSHRIICSFCFYKRHTKVLNI